MFALVSVRNCALPKFITGTYILYSIVLYRNITAERSVTRSVEPSVHLAQFGEEFAKLGEQLAQLGEHLAQLGEQFAQLGEHLAQLGQQFAQLGEQFTQFGEQFVQLGEQFAKLGETPHSSLFKFCVFC